MYSTVIGLKNKIREIDSWNVLLDITPKCSVATANSISQSLPLEMW